MIDARKRLRIIAALVLITSAPATRLPAEESEASKPVLRVVFFTPSDVQPPDGVRDRLKEYVDYCQMFFGKWMKHWGYASESALPVERDDEGFPKILFVKGRHDEASGRYRQLGFQPEVVQAACQKYKLDPQGQVWWIFTYKGPASRGFRGGGNATRGGTSTSIYDPNDMGRLRLEDELGSDEQARIKSKGSIHELGHAFGLPHIGPLEQDKLGNSLMGPVIKAYRSRYPKETRVYLTKASAAMLWKHPLFSGTTKDRELVPSFEFEEFEATHEKTSNRIVVSGKVVSSYKVHSIVVANESEATRSDYWRKCFAGRIADDGLFHVEVGELDDADGRLRIVCCFNNGAVVGKDGGLGLRSGFAKRYHAHGEMFTFDDGWATEQPGQTGGRRRGPGTNSPRRRPVPRQ